MHIPLHVWLSFNGDANPEAEKDELRGVSHHVAGIVTLEAEASDAAWRKEEAKMLMARSGVRECHKSSASTNFESTRAVWTILSTHEKIVRSVSTI